jgi:hypothetical protein
MKSYNQWSRFLLGLFALALVSCTETEIDEEKPTITVNYAGGFPQTCENLSRGQSYTIKAKVADNLELASYSIEMHHNFDHHTHDDQEDPCELEPITTAVNPFVFSTNGRILQGSTNYELDIDLIIPDGADTGDYHLALSITDVTGWQARTSVDVKIVE